ncbi:hypothetical protein [Pedobacter arcticus]|uniref:hypothetical protein n=1 Tax=Pedobacter arcticus TaxID=752140 RepID=UPI00037C7104|nr:hypothetical protein [Pedobacter arcticus]
MSDLQKQSTSSTTGLLVGLMFGFLIGLAMFKATPKSERSDAFPYLVGLGVLFSTYAGYKIGAFNDHEHYRDEYLGIKNIRTNYQNDENGWAIQSFWKQHPDKENSLVTTVLDGEMVTIFNGLVLIVHGASNSRSADKLHEEVKKDVVQRLKDGFIR